MLPFIIHLEDHGLFSKGFEIIVMPDLAGCEYKHIQHPDDAILAIKKLLEEGITIHAVVTDFNHPGMNGYDFAKKIKNLKEKYNVDNFPIVILTMVDKSHPLIEQGLKSSVFNKYFSKASSKEELIEYFQSIAS